MCGGGGGELCDLGVSVTLLRTQASDLRDSRPLC